MDFTLQTATHDDLAFFAALFAEARAPEFAPANLPPEFLQQLLAMQFQAQTSGYAAQFPNAQDDLILVNGERAGRQIVDRDEKQIRLIDIALLERFRGHGIGSALLQKLCDESVATHRPIGLYVRSGTRAQNLYTRFGFAAIGGDGINLAMEFRPGAKQKPADTAEPEPLPGIDAAIDQDYTSLYFRTLVGKTLSFEAPGAPPAPLTLDAVRPLPEPRGGLPVDLNDSFRLELTGPLEPVFNGTITMTQQDAAPMNIFLVPLGPENGRMQYESIFNRMTPRADARLQQR